MMRTLLLLTCAMLLPLSGCGVKGKLQSPAQIETKQKKEARKKEKQNKAAQPSQAPAQDAK